MPNLSCSFRSPIWLAAPMLQRRLNALGYRPNDETVHRQLIVIAAAC